MADERIQIEIQVDVDEGSVRSEFKKIEEQGERSGVKAGKEFGEGLTRSAKRGLSGLQSVAIAAAGAIAAALAGREIIAASARQQDAVNNLNASLSRIGEFSQQTSQDLQEFASALQQTTKFGDEATLEQLAFAQSLGATADQSKDIVAAAADLSAALNIDFNSAVRNVGRTLGGFAGELGEVIPELRNLSREQLQAGAAVDLLASKFAGAAAAQVNTFEGRLTQLGNAFGDFQESVGNIITQSPALTAVIGAIGDLFAQLSGRLNQFAGSGDVLRPLILRLIDIAQVLNEFITPAFASIGRVASVVFDAVIVGANTVVAGIGKIGAAFAKLLNFTGVGEELATTLKTFAESSDEVLEESIVPLNEELSKILDPIEFQERTDQFLASLEQTVETAGPLLENFADRSERASKRIGDAFKKTSIDIGKAVTGALTKSVVGGIQAVTNALVFGEGGFKQFAAAVAGVMGDLAIQLGALFIAAGLGIESTKALAGAAAVVAGAALIAVGTILKGLSGGANISGPSTGLDGGGGVGGFGIGGFGDPTVADQPEVEEQTAAVNLTIQGDVLDSEETGLRIVQIINESFEQDGAVITNGNFAT